jgi:hypothetical protein
MKTLPDYYDMDLAMSEGWLLVEVDGKPNCQRIERYDLDPEKRFTNDAQAIAWVRHNQGLAGHYARAWDAHCKSQNSELTDAQLARLGSDIANALGLRRDREHPDRWVTGWGSKTSLGLAITLRHLLQ